MKKKIFTVLSSVLCASPSFASGSQDYPLKRNFPWVNVPVGTVYGPTGHIGIDLIMTDQNDQNPYTPQHNVNPEGREPFYGANCMANSGWKSYYIVKQFNADGSNDFPYGIFIENVSNNICYNNPSQYCASTVTNNNTPSLTHNWARKLSKVVLEFYPQADPINYGGLRFEVTAFNNQANGGVYGPSLGNITLPRAGLTGVARLNGFFWKNGQAFKGAGRTASIVVFQQGSTWTTSNGYPAQGFNTAEMNADAYYKTAPLPWGNYKTYVTMTDGSTEKLYVIYLDFTTLNDQADFHFEKACFGWGVPKSVQQQNEPIECER